MYKVIIIFLFLSCFSCQESPSKKAVISSNINRIELKNELTNLLNDEKAKLVMAFVDYFELYLNNRYKNYPADKQIYMYLKDYKDFVEKEEKRIDFGYFTEYTKAIYETGLINEFIITNNKYLDINEKVYYLYDSIYYNHFSEHYDMHIDSIIYKTDKENINIPVDNVSVFHNPFNSVYYSLHKTAKNDVFFKNMLGEKLIYNYSALNLAHTLLDKKQINLNNIHYKTYIAFETILFHYDNKTGDFSR